MKSSNALFQFFNKGPTCNPDKSYEPVNVRELKSFKEACTFDEYHELAQQACKLMNVEWEAP